jgi:hypothetical protein
MFTKLVLNKLKVMENFTFIYMYWTPNSKKFFNKILVEMCPMFTHVYPMCTYMWIMNESKLN